MTRWEPDAASRLERAALELFGEQGYAATTVPQIAERAGLTTRSFFRHFADKREVLFFYEREFPEVVRAAMADLPADLTPIELLMRGLETVTATRFNDWRTHLVFRRRLVQADAGLHERELLKLTVLAEEIRASLLDHGVDEPTADLLAPMGVTIFDLSMSRWLDGDGTQSFLDCIHETQVTFRAATAS